MMRKRLFLAALAALWASAGCEAWHEHWCAKHGFCRPACAPAYAAPAPQCCVPYNPCGPQPAAYAPAAAAPAWNAPIPAPAGGTCCQPCP